MFASLLCLAHRIRLRESRNRALACTRPYITHGHNTVGTQLRGTLYPLRFKSCLEAMAAWERKRYAIAQAIGYYGPADMRLRAQAHKPAPHTNECTPPHSTAHTAATISAPLAHTPPPHSDPPPLAH
ncbi:hypothetical protein B0H13DRAFT_1883083 [Mycena leptocephala]|nr:hypothetical protein B0H13DRAFT_1883083 [Mycena leptocephala]